MPVERTLRNFWGIPSWREEYPRRGEFPLSEAIRQSSEIRTTEPWNGSKISFREQKDHFSVRSGYELDGGLRLNKVGTIGYF